MKLTSVLAAILGIGLVSSATAGVKVIGYANGCAIVCASKIGVFTPSVKQFYHYPTNQVGVLYPGAYGVGPGVYETTMQAPAVAGGSVGAAAVRRPDQIKVTQSASPTALGQGGDSFSNAEGGAGGNATATAIKGSNNGNGGNPHQN